MCASYGLGGGPYREGKSDIAEQARTLRAQQLSYRQIGARLGVSRQRAWQILNPPHLTTERAAELERMRAEWRAERDTLEP